MSCNKNIIFALSASKKVGDQTSKKLDCKLSDIVIEKFLDGEIYVKSKQTVRNRDVVVIQSVTKPVNDNLMELLIAIDALKRASAKSVTAIVPYYGYGRQDRKASSREPITAKLVANLLEKAGADRVATYDIHSNQTQGFFDIPFDVIPFTNILVINFAEDYNINDFIVVSPDYGSVKKSRSVADLYDLELAILDKRRPKANQAEMVNILGDVKNKNCLIVDDMIDSGGTMIAACELLKKNGAKKIVICATHGIFSGKAIENFNDAFEKGVIDKIYISDTIESVYDSKIKCLKIVPIARTVAALIDVYSGRKDSINCLFDKYKLHK